MYDTHVTIVGNALHNPQWRKTANTGAMVTTFKIASTARRMDRESGRWVDGNSLRVRVTCWRSLAENVKNSVTSGDPLIVTGRLFTRDWEDENGAKRIAYELEASSVGHDLSRGRAVFERVKSNTTTSVIDDAEAEKRIGGELTEPVPDTEAPTQFNDMSFEDALEGGLAIPSPASAARGEHSAPTAAPAPAVPAGGDAALHLADREVMSDELTPVAVAEPGGSGRGESEPGGFEAGGSGRGESEPGGFEAGGFGRGESEPGGFEAGGSGRGGFEAGESSADQSGPGAPASGEPVDEPSSGRRRGLRRARSSA